MQRILSAYQEHRSFILITATLTLLRLVVAPMFGLGVDEAHYVLYAKHLSLSYFDHPPLVGWTHALFFYTIGTNEFLGRLPAILLFIATSLLCYRFTLRLGSKRQALLAVLGLNSSFLLTGLGLMLLPESLLLPIAFGLVLVVWDLEQSPDTKQYLLLGLVLGLAGLSKYTAILFVPPLALYLIVKRRYDLALNPRLVLGALVALLLIAPVIIWNVQNDFASFRFQSGHVVGTREFSLPALVASFGSQFGAYSPPLFCIAFYGLYRSLRSRAGKALLPGLVAAAVFIFFLYASLFKFSLPHWSAVFYALCIPIGIVELDNSSVSWKRGLIAGSLAFSVILTLLLHTEMAIKAFRFPDYRSPFADVVGVPEVMQRANEVLARDAAAKKALGVLNWTDASRALYYNMPYASEVFLLSKSDDRFSRWITGKPEGRDILVITHIHDRDMLRELNCGEQHDADQLAVMLHGGIVDTYDFVWCRGYRGLK
jgi:hypothetical protein